VAAILGQEEFELTGAVARRAAGQTVGDVQGETDGSRVRISADVGEALRESADVYIDYTHPSAVYGNIMCAIEAGVAAVVGTSGLTGREYGEIDEAARAAGVGVIAAGNFSITAALLQHLSGIAARHLPHWALVDMAADSGRCLLVFIGARLAAAACSIQPPGRTERLRHDQLPWVRSRVAAAAVAT